MSSFGSRAAAVKIIPKIRLYYFVLTGSMRILTISLVEGFSCIGSHALFKVICILDDSMQVKFCSEANSEDAECL